MVEKTQAQVLVTASSDGILMKSTPANWYKKVREMRRDPTIGFVRDLYMAPILTSDWTVVSDSPKYKNAEQLIWHAFVPKRRQFLHHCVRGLMDFGWQSFEKVFAQGEDGYITVKKLKPLLQDISDILVTHRGDYKGIRNQPVMSTGGAFWVDLSKDEAMLFSDDVEGTNWYGEAKMRRVEGAYDSWNSCNNAADRFDKKIAGAHWVVYYPIGQTLYNGVETDNYQIARDILNALESSGKIAIPQKLLNTLKELDDAADGNVAWKVDLLSASTSSASAFVDRQKYLDALKSRGLGIPERAVMEGEFGTKAEAEAHADFAIDNIEMGHQDILEQLNADAVNQVLELNFGRHYRDHVKIHAMPLSDFKREQLQALYTAYFQNTDGFADEVDNVDWAAIREQLDIPTRKEGAPATAPNPAQLPDPSKAIDVADPNDAKKTPGAPESKQESSDTSKLSQIIPTMNGAHLRNAFRTMLKRHKKQSGA